MRLSAQYPALQMADYPRKDILKSHEAMQQEGVQRTLHRTRPRRVVRNFMRHEAGIARIRDWHQHNPARMEWVLAPDIKPCQTRLDHPFRADDVTFRGWLADQADKVYSLTHDDLDEQLKRILAGQGTDQKGTHQGWKTWQHALTATMLLETDSFAPQFRKSMRMAMLLHDIGKTTDKTVWTAGCHAAYGAKIWPRTGVETERHEAALITFLIAHHDLLGELDKTIKDPSYPAGLSVMDAAYRVKKNPIGDDHKALDMICAINDADIGSLSSLRYYRGLTPLLSNLIRPELR